jgi:hypothetical protein
LLLVLCPLLLASSLLPLCFGVSVVFCAIIGSIRISSILIVIVVVLLVKIVFFVFRSPFPAFLFEQLLDFPPGLRKVRSNPIILICRCDTSSKFTFEMVGTAKLSLDSLFELLVLIGFQDIISDLPDAFLIILEFSLKLELLVLVILELNCE